MAAISDEHLEKTILETIRDKEEIADSFAFAKEIGVDHTVLFGRIRSLVADGILLDAQFDRQVISLADEGKMVLQHGSQEFLVVSALKDGPLSKDDLTAKVGAAIAPIGIANASKKKWISFNKTTSLFESSLSVAVDETVEQIKNAVCESGKADKAVIEELKKRKMIVVQVQKGLSVKKGPSFSLERKEKVTDITVDLLKRLQSGTVKLDQLTVKSINLNAKGVPPEGGFLHPLLKVRAEYRKIFLEMGFQEMATQRYVESSFWNFDTLFQPQAHPARDAHDTFFLKSPAETVSLPADFVEKTKQIHEKGGFGSKGYRYDWLLQEAKKNLLRTHTTAISSQVLYNLAQEKTFTPSKFFSIDRVFRNETLDATHLAEFHQVEGIIIDRNLGLGHLIGVLRAFFHKLGITKLRFKPAYNPYTEPSMEIFSWMDGLNKWVEIGNSGVFRPEMLRPMGFPEDVSAIAWGLSVERPTMILYKLSNIRDLFGHKIDLAMVRSNPICRIVKDDVEDNKEGMSINSINEAAKSA